MASVTSVALELQRNLDGHFELEVRAGSKLLSLHLPDPAAPDIDKLARAVMSTFPTIPIDSLRASIAQTMSTFSTTDVESGEVCHEQAVQKSQCGRSCGLCPFVGQCGKSTSPTIPQPFNRAKAVSARQGGSNQ